MHRQLWLALTLGVSACASFDGCFGNTPPADPPGQPGTGTQWHVSPTGLATNAGTEESPWDLASALAQRSEIAAGDAIWLHAGTYAGVFDSTLSGTRETPTLVRVAPGERAILADNRRNAGGAALQINGGWTTYWGLEITNTNEARGVLPNDASPRFRPMATQVQGPNVSLVNFVVHDTGHAFGFWREAVDAEIYGALVYNCGSQNTDTDVTHGHGVYAQNDTGEKRITDSIFLNGFGFGVHMYPNPGGTQGFRIEGNVVAESGVLSDSAWRLNTILVGGYGSYPADRIHVLNNFTYHGVDSAPEERAIYANACFNCIDLGLGGSLELRGNTFAGGLALLGVANFTDVTARDNAIVGSNILVSHQSPASATRSDWGNNHYYGGRTLPFGANGSALNFAGWQAAMNGDATSTHSLTMPTGAWVALRQNRYEPDRAFLVVYNWSLSPTVDADVSTFLEAGDDYEVRLAADPFAPPILTGTWESGPLTFPMTGHSVAAPVGWLAAASSAPRFAVFLIRKS
ncbi:MAG: hypothetical protein ACKVPX_04755 [Myxococcaceae bacterium]